MSSTAVPVSIRIMGKEYMVSCPVEERESLLESARLLDTRIQETRAGGKVLGLERMTVMAALNIAHELLQFRAERSAFEAQIQSEVNRLIAKLEQANARRRDAESLD